jgi:hypothetical protein
VTEPIANLGSNLLMVLPELIVFHGHHSGRKSIIQQFTGNTLLIHQTGVKSATRLQLQP